MNFQDYQKRINRAIPDHTSKKDEILHWAIGLSEECGEVMSVLKHHFYGGEDLSKEELGKEVGDVLWYLSMLCTACNINIDVAAELNVAKLEHRFPTNDFSNENSANRHDLEKKFSDTDLYKQLIGRL